MNFSEPFRTFGHVVTQLAALAQVEHDLEDDKIILLVHYKDNSGLTIFLGTGYIHSDFFEGLLDEDQYQCLFALFFPEEEIEKAEENDLSYVQAKEVFLDEGDLSVYVGLGDLVAALSQIVFASHPLDTKQ